MSLRLTIFATALVGCVANNDNLPLGSADVSTFAEKTGGYERNEHWQIASAWAQPYESYPIGTGANFFDKDDGFGGMAIMFSAETTSPAPPRCRDSQLLDTYQSDIEIDTNRRGSVSLDTGDVPFTDAVDLSLSVYACFKLMAIDQTMELDSGHITITAVDDEHITGTFEGTGSNSTWEGDGSTGTESVHVVGSFDVPICN